MKVRFGFVSNSSSSSFCIYGICIDNEDLIKQFALDENGDIDFWDVLNDHFPGFNQYYDYENERSYVGLGINDMKDDETKKEFQQRVNTKLNSIMPNQSSYWFEETIES